MQKRCREPCEYGVTAAAIGSISVLAAGLALIVVVIGDERQYQRRTGAAGIADVSLRSHSVCNACRCWRRRSTYDFHGSKLMLNDTNLLTPSPYNAEFAAQAAGCMLQVACSLWSRPRKVRGTRKCRIKTPRVIPWIHRRPYIVPPPAPPVQ